MKFLFINVLLIYSSEDKLIGHFYSLFIKKPTFVAKFDLGLNGHYYATLG